MSQKYEEALRSFDASYAGAGKVKSAEFLALVAASRRANVARSLRATNPQHAVDFLDAAKQFHSTAAVAPEDERFIMERLAATAFIEVAADHADKLRPIHEASKLPRWMQATLEGAIEVEVAWDIRGGGFAPSVTEKGWEGFALHLAKARRYLAEAWKLRPDMPFAPAKMIGVVMAGAGEGEETERLWFDRAVAAQYDYAAGASSRGGADRTSNSSPSEQPARAPAASTPTFRPT